MVQGTAPSGYVVSYNPSGGYLFGNSIAGSTITVTVSGGPAYLSSNYTLLFQKNAAQSPRLTSLSINQNTIPGFSSSQLVYEYAVEDDTEGNVPFNFAWTYNSGEVNYIAYSENGGQWSDTSGIATAPVISLAPLESKVILIKVRTIDGNEAVYYVTVRRRSAFKLTSLEIKDDITEASLFATESSFSSAVSYYPITVPNGTSIVAVSATSTPGSTVSIIQNGLSHQQIPLEVCQPVTVTVSIHPQSSPAQISASYNFVITRERPAGFYIGTNTTPICTTPEEPQFIMSILSGEVVEPPEELLPPGGSEEGEPGDPEPGDESEPDAPEPGEPGETVPEEPPEPQPIKTLTGALSWLSTNAVSNTAYTLILEANEDSPPVVLNSATFNSQDNITFTLGATTSDVIVSLTGTGALFTVDSGINFILDRNIHLRGSANNTQSVVVVNEVNSGTTSPTLTMKEGSKISGNSLNGNDYGGGITVGQNGYFTMRGGEISGNYSPASGGGILIGLNGTVKIYGGLISGNTAAFGGGGGISVANLLEMYGGLIQLNEAYEGGGLNITSTATALITGGTIKSNYAGISGGGIFIAEHGSVAFSGGTIMNNSIASISGSYNVFGAARFNNTSGQTIPGVVD
jgi:hypothetical protein